MQPEKFCSGDTASAIEALKYAASEGEPLAQWKLAKIYANGDGVSRDDLRAYDYFSQIVSNKSGRVLLRHAAAKCRRYMAYFCTAAYIRPIESSNAP